MTVWKVRRWRKESSDLAHFDTNKLKVAYTSNDVVCVALGLGGRFVGTNLNIS